MKEVKPNCLNCYYGGSGIREKCIASCDCEQRTDRLKNEEEKRMFVSTENENFDIECNYFIPMLEYDEYEIEPVTSFELRTTCPFCGNVQTLYDVSGEDNKLIECDECEKQYGVSWCVY